MAQYHNTSGCSHTIEGIIREAKKEILIVSPYLRLNDWLIELLKGTSRTLPVTFIYGKAKRQDGLDRIRELPNVEIRFKENLHGKCYLNEDRCLITSMNLFDYSQINNIEFGVEVSRAGDVEMYDSIRSDISIIERSSEFVMGIRKPQLDTKTIPALADQITMSEIWAVLGNYKYKAGVVTNEPNSLYRTICRFAYTLRDFSDSEKYQDKTGLLRTTVLTKEMGQKIINHFEALRR